MERSPERAGLLNDLKQLSGQVIDAAITETLENLDSMSLTLKLFHSSTIGLWPISKVYQYQLFDVHGQFDFEKAEFDGLNLNLASISHINLPQTLSPFSQIFYALILEVAFEKLMEVHGPRAIKLPLQKNTLFDDFFTDITIHLLAFENIYPLRIPPQLSLSLNQQLAFNSPPITLITKALSAKELFNEIQNKGIKHVFIESEAFLTLAQSLLPNSLGLCQSLPNTYVLPIDSYDELDCYIIHLDWQTTCQLTLIQGKSPLSEIEKNALREIDEKKPSLFLSQLANGKTKEIIEQHIRYSKNSANDILPLIKDSHQNDGTFEKLFLNDNSLHLRLLLIDIINREKTITHNTEKMLSSLIKLSPAKNKKALIPFLLTNRTPKSLTEKALAINDFDVLTPPSDSHLVILQFYFSHHQGNLLSHSLLFSFIAKEMYISSQPYYVFDRYITYFKNQMNGLDENEIIDEKNQLLQFQLKILLSLMNSRWPITEKIEAITLLVFKNLLKNKDEIAEIANAKTIESLQAFLHVCKENPNLKTIMPNIKEFSQANLKVWQSPINNITFFLNKLRQKLLLNQPFTPSPKEQAWLDHLADDYQELLENIPLGATTLREVVNEGFSHAAMLNQKKVTDAQRLENELSLLSKRTWGNQDAKNFIALFNLIKESPLSFQQNHPILLKLVCMRMQHSKIMGLYLEEFSTAICRFFLANFNKIKEKINQQPDLPLAKSKIVSDLMNPTLSWLNEDIKQGLIKNTPDGLIVIKPIKSCYRFINKNGKKFLDTEKTLQIHWLETYLLTPLIHRIKDTISPLLNINLFQNDWHNALNADDSIQQNKLGLIFEKLKTEIQMAKKIPTNALDAINLLFSPTSKNKIHHFSRLENLTSASLFENSLNDKKTQSIITSTKNLLSWIDGLSFSYEDKNHCCYLDSLKNKFLLVENFIEAAEKKLIKQDDLLPELTKIKCQMPLLAITKNHKNDTIVSNFYSKTPHTTLYQRKIIDEYKDNPSNVAPTDLNCQQTVLSMPKTADSKFFTQLFILLMQCPNLSLTQKLSDDFSNFLMADSNRLKTLIDSHLSYFSFAKTFCYLDNCLFKILSFPHLKIDYFKYALNFSFDKNTPIFQLFLLLPISLQYKHHIHYQTLMKLSKDNLKNASAIDYFKKAFHKIFPEYLEKMMCFFKMDSHFLAKVDFTKKQDISLIVHFEKSTSRLFAIINFLATMPNLWQKNRYALTELFKIYHCVYQHPLVKTKLSHLKEKMHQYHQFSINLQSLHLKDKFWQQQQKLRLNYQKKHPYAFILNYFSSIDKSMPLSTLIHHAKGRQAILTGFILDNQCLLTMQSLGWLDKTGNIVQNSELGKLISGAAQCQNNTLELA